MCYFRDSVYGKIWSLFFKNGFNSFGKKSTIRYPRKIEKREYISIGSNVTVMNGGWLLTLNEGIDRNVKLNIQDGAYIGYYSHIVAMKSVDIGKKVLIADKVYISDCAHEYDDVEISIIDQGLIFKNEVSIGDGSWIGENACIIGGKVGQHCIIGANSVVTRNIPDYSIAVGSPAIIIKRYNADEKRWVRTDKVGNFLQMTPI